MVSKLKRYGELVMFSHTIFSLPFGLVSMFIAAGGFPDINKFIWIIVALFGARNGANAFNRIADKQFDKKNKRTSGRHIPMGIVSVKEAWLIVIFCFLFMLFACYKINLLCLILAPVAITMCIAYSYTKRFTWLCHVFLGITCGIASVGAWIAIRGSLDIIPSFTNFFQSFDAVPIILFAIVACWVSGFDIVYATQDIEFDTREGLFSIPKAFGERLARIIAIALHVCAVALLFLFYFVADRGYVYITGIIIITILLAIEHRIITPHNTKKMNIASYSINQVVSIVFFVFTSIDLVIF